MNIPPMRSVRLPGGRSSVTCWSPLLPSGKAKVRFLVAIEGASLPLAADGSAIVN